MPHLIRAREFLEISDQFKLGNLPTEKPHPKTKELSNWSKNELIIALEAIKEIELELFDTALMKQADIRKLSKDIESTLETGGRIFLCGCGATGRLSLALEAIWNKSEKEVGRVISFMAGGDVALIHSIEKFEDHFEYGARQLEELGFSENDLLMAITEGGETPFVIGAVNRASELSKLNPYFVYCNPDKELCENVERSRDVITNPNIKKLNLFVGEMVLAGSTRMQASTIQMLAVGQALFSFDEKWLLNLLENFRKIDFSALKEFIEEESASYEKGGGVVYSTSGCLGMTVLTDTTERSPTFSLLPFEQNSGITPNKYSLCYLSLKDSSEVESSWSSLLGREPRTLEWSNTKGLTGIDRLYGFNISSKVYELRKSYCSGEQYIFTIDLVDHHLCFNFRGVQRIIEVDNHDLLSAHLILKIILNTHSTLVMGRLGRFESNIMTWVRPSNNKLIDRAIRYIIILLNQYGYQKNYEEVCIKLFEVMEEAKSDDSLVLLTLERFLKII